MGSYGAQIAKFKEGSSKRFNSPKIGWESEFPIPGSEQESTDSPLDGRLWNNLNTRTVLCEEGED